MKALLVNGSPHKLGCMHTALQVHGRNMAWLMGSIEAGRAAGVEPPMQPERRIGTNFIR